MLAAELLVNFGDDGITNLLDVLEMAFKILLLGVLLIGTEPALAVLQGILDERFVAAVDFISELIAVVDGSLHGIKVLLEALLGLKLLLENPILLGILLSIMNHALNILFRETTLVIGNCDRLCLAGATLFSSNGKY